MALKILISVAEVEFELSIMKIIKISNLATYI